ncbi:MAG: 3-oxoacyl-ACP reductase FabG [Colwellia sp.]|uniref:3-oxoacyl-ACP reductase FabG n=1 Tax=Colwellia sp. TaxID=56799 RepID=UPI0025C61066|nr:3-oxoacyl-ACP reductase FabG [Colwellia sp.]NQZ28142.1 3-oxoacyl-ACP reductase FabG [Colwellia sp.]
MNNTVLVTGSSKGIGKAIAIELAKSGFDIVVHYNSDIKGAQETLTQVNLHQSDGNSRIVQFDIANEEQSRQVLTSDIAEFGAYYGVVCNAGVHSDNAFPSMTSDEWHKVIHTNLDGFYHVVHPLIMPMIQLRKGGRIVAISSVSGILGNRGQVNYSASKAGLIGAVKALALELAKRKITVNCVAPGIIKTEMTEDMPDDMIKQLVPMRRAGSDFEVAATVNFLFSSGANYITRQVISVDGGLS